MRNISFALTTPQFKARTKTVTRRLGWQNLRPGDLLQAVEKSQGLKPGQHPVKLGVIRIVSVCREPLWALTIGKSLNGFYTPESAQYEVEREGFPQMTPQQFVDMFCRHMDCTTETFVNRIEFEYVDP